MNERITKVRQALQAAGIDQIIISDYYNILYFTGIAVHVGERLMVLLVGRDICRLIVNDLFPLPTQPDLELVYYNDAQDSVAVLSEQLQGQRIAVDANWPSGFLLRLMAVHPAAYLQGSDITSLIRAIKDPREQAYMLQASIDNDEVMRRIRPYLKAGVSEKEIAAILQQLFLKVAGAISFDAIVAFGENGANPHAVISERRLKPGDSVIIDMGSRHHGYCSDMTRTFFYQQNTLDDVYEVVLKANLAAIAVVRPGVRFCDIDAAARDVIKAAGYGPYFTHRTGHGIGLEVHEPYDVSAADTREVQAGMFFSIEPGIYLPDRGGVRIEDLVMVTEAGCQVLNHYDKTQPLIDDGI